MTTTLSPFEAGAAAMHEVFAELRAAGPAHRVRMPNGTPVWLVTRHAEARALLTDPRLISPGNTHSKTGALAPELRAALLSGLMHSNPPDHTRLRRLISAVFTPRRVQELRPRIEQIAEDLLTGLGARTSFDLVREYALPLPLLVISELLGVPPADRAGFADWTRAYVYGLGMPEFPAEAVTELLTYLRELIELKRVQPGDDLFSGLIQAHDEGDRLTTDELTSLGCLLLAAGYETTANLISSGMWLLLRHPEHAERLRREPAGLPAAVEEIARYESPAQCGFPRLTTAPVRLGEVEIPQGELVLISVLSANRDENVHPAADEFRPDQAPKQHLAYGHGIRFCLGAYLARVEGEVAIGALLHRFPRLRLAGEPSWSMGVFVRGLADLPVSTVD